MHPTSGNNPDSTNIDSLRRKVDRFKDKDSDSAVKKLGKGFLRKISPQYKIAKSKLAKAESDKAATVRLKDRHITNTALPETRRSPYDPLPELPDQNQSRSAPISSRPPSGATKPAPHSEAPPPPPPRSSSNRPSLPPRPSHALSVAKAQVPQSNAINYENWFDDLKQATQEEPSYNKGELLGGARFTNILPPKHSAVNINKQPINANYTFDQNYIASQAPMMNNEQGLPAFFSMIASEGITSVVNLTNSNDEINKRTGLQGTDLRAQYWPEPGGLQQHFMDGQWYSVENMETEKHTGYDITKLSLHVQAPDGSLLQESKEIKVFHFTDWPDHGVPSGDGMKKFDGFMSQVKNQSGESPKLVHCRAGVGRTGTFMVLEQLKKGIDTGTINNNNLTEKINQLVLEGRGDRGKAFVQANTQLQMIHEQAQAYLQKRSGY
ncbi:protein-tyrosine phosphatase family protein [uncultured Endozoicomonas sp.]|uniref:protein tyrosine phosphatase family protein n=1 Tax=uncultured Endozoicomonas sp. TaxID=432652 RepID=UPI00261A567D|nr:protein-tyrosine phosphatase family protein [uncultured Endozoicomonas sp.]